MRVLLHEVNRLFQADSGKEVACVAETFRLKVNEHILYVLDLFRLLENIIEKHTLDFKIREIAQIAG